MKYFSRYGLLQASILCHRLFHIKLRPTRNKCISILVCVFRSIQRRRVLLVVYLDHLSGSPLKASIFTLLLGCSGTQMPTTRAYSFCSERVEHQLLIGLICDMLLSLQSWPRLSLDTLSWLLSLEYLCLQGRATVISSSSVLINCDQINVEAGWINHCHAAIRQHVRRVRQVLVASHLSNLID